MSKKPHLATIVSLFAVFSLGAAAAAQVERLEITERQPFAEGRSFGLAGPYEIWKGQVFYRIDPQRPENRRVVDLDKAIRDDQGKVPYSAEVLIVRPVDPSRGNGALLVDVVNRGNPISLGFNFPNWQFRQPTPGDMAGDGFLMRHGFTVVAIGWQADVPAPGGPFSVRLRAPRATAGAESVEGLVRSEMVFDDDATILPLSHWDHVAYPVADPDDPRNVLTVRDSELDRRRVIPRERWSFTAEGTSIEMADGFEQGKLYEAVFVARDPFVAGLGFTAVRDFVAWLKHDPESPVAVDRSLAYGGSQSARWLRHFVYEGWNADLEGRRVLDGVFSLVGGAGRGSFNHRFAQPSRSAAAYTMFHYPTDVFPFTGAVQKDPVTGKSAGLFDAAATAGVVPKTFHVDSSSEYWNRAASLVHTTPDGRAEVGLLPNERIYHLTGTQHFGVPIPPPRRVDLGAARVSCSYPMNPASTQWPLRALLLALDAWVARGEEPPPSRYPRIDAGELVEPAKYELPAIPGVRRSPRPYVARRIDYGPRFESEGIVDRQPPVVGEAYGVRVPQVDADGNEIGGLMLPEIRVPLATYTSWNGRDPEDGAPDELCILAGGFFPLPRTRDERKAAGDPRASVEERYASKEEYVGRYALAAAELVREGYLLAEDVAAMVGHAGFLWDFVHEEAGEGDAGRED